MYTNLHAIWTPPPPFCIGGGVGWGGVADVVKVSALLVEVAIVPVRFPATATKMDIWRPPAQKVPQ